MQQFLSVFMAPAGDAWDFLTRSSNLERFITDSTMDAACVRVRYNPPTGSECLCNGHEGEDQTVAMAKALACAVLGMGGIYPPCMTEAWTWSEVGSENSKEIMRRWRVQICHGIECADPDTAQLSSEVTPLYSFDEFTLLGIEGDYYQHVVEFCYMLCMNARDMSMRATYIRLAVDHGLDFKQRLESREYKNKANKSKRPRMDPEQEYQDESKES